MKSKEWTTENISGLSGTVVVVTGSSSGIGYETTRVVANKGAETIIAVRNLDKGNGAAEKIRSQNPRAAVKVMKLDLADLASVRRFSEDFKREYLRLDRLINNAGVMIPPCSKTVDGFELQFGTNHLGHFALTAGLFDVLRLTPNARVVNVSSSAHRFGHIDFEDLAWEKRQYRPWIAYGDSKIANLYFTYELDRRLKAGGTKVIATASHPGWTATELQRHTRATQLLNGIFAQDISMGALPTLRAAYDANARGGEFYGPRGLMEFRGYPVEVVSNRLSQDHAIAARLWSVSQALTGVRFDAGRSADSAIA
jgi:NAD(P)-dependent dehydrogenase (short-subunit alcohol dehydrogenase family)